MLIIDKNQKTNWKYILILLILAVIAGGGILKCYFEFSKIISSQIKILPSQKGRKKAEEEVVIITDKTEYKTEETVKVTIKNNLGKSIWYYEWCISDCDKSLCECGDSFFVERREQNEYKVYSLPNSIYQEIMSPLVELKPNSEKTYQLKLIKFPKGTYRLGFFFGFNKKEPPRDVTIYSNEFEVSEEKINEISDWKTYRNEKYGFELRVPKILKIKEFENTTRYEEPVLLLVTFTGDSYPLDAVTFDLVVKENNQRMSSKEWFLTTVKGSEDEIEEIKISGYPAIRWRSKAVPIDRYFIVKEDKVYEVWPTEGSKLSDEEINEMLSEILSTFKFIKENKEDMIYVETPKPYQVIESPLLIKGRARGYWFFEGSFLLRLIDNHGNEIATGVASALSNWMTEDFVPFEAQITFQKPETKEGILILIKENPSGLPEYSDELRIPIRFSE